MAGNLVTEDSSSVQDLQDPSITCEHHQKEIQALKEEHAQEMLERDRELNALKEEHERQMWLIELGNMNNPMETPAPAQAATYFNSNHFASQMA